MAKSGAAYRWKMHRPSEQDAAPIALHVAGMQGKVAVLQGADVPPAHGKRNGDLAVGWYSHRDAVTQELTYIGIS